MKKYIYFWILISLFALVGCDLADKAEEKVTKEYERIVHQYEEYTGKNGEERGERPFAVVYQEDENAKTAMISSSCLYNTALNYTYYITPADAHRSFLNDTNNFISYPGNSTLKPFWDMRYVNPVSKYMDGGDYTNYPNHGEHTGLDTRTGVRNITIGTDASQTDADAGVVQAECVNGIMAASTTINLFDAPEQYLDYAGPQSTFSYRIGHTSVTSPWTSNGKGNLVIQASFNKPFYFNYSDNLGGGVYMGLFIRNKKTGKFLNYVIGVYAAGAAWIEEKSGIRFDPTTNIIHVATVIKESSWWSTISPKSQSIQEVFSEENQKRSDNGTWNDFYRVNISYKNLLVVLQELKNNLPAGAEGQDFGLSPEDWEVTSIMIQYELEEGGGKAALSGSFRGFEAYVSNNPL